MSKKLAFALLIAACVAFGAFWMFFNRPPSEPQPLPGAEPQVAPNTTGIHPATKRQLHEFKKFDLNGDGSCPQEEFKQAHWNNFNEQDKNKNGLIEKGEFPWRAIVHSDTNKDKKLDRSEYEIRYQKLFAELDANKDGVLIPQEL
jgi:Ca2+-binding EF-hand superfamily protein